ncbi:hypothetical protein ACFE04_001108 [Oxalis oulophora]
MADRTQYRAAAATMERLEMRKDSITLIQKKLAMESSSSYLVEQDPNFSFKHQTLMQDYQFLIKDMEFKRKKLEILKHKKLTLMAEVRFLRGRHHQLTQNHSFKPRPHNSKARNYNGNKAGLPPLVPRVHLSKKGKIHHGKDTTLPNQMQSSSKQTVIDLNQKETVDNRIEEMTRNRPPVFDLNQISREVEEELQANGEPESLEELKKSSIRGGSDEQLNEMVLAACRTIGKGANRTGKRKISWQDQVALRV